MRSAWDRRAGRLRGRSALQRQVRQADLLAGPDLRDDLGHVRVDLVDAQRPRNRHAVVAVADEVQLTDPEHGDRRHRLAAALRLRDPLPAAADSAGRGTEAAVELARAVDGADDRVKRDGLEPEPALAPVTERLDHLVEGEDQVDVVGLAAQPAGQAGELLVPARAAEVALGVLGGKAGVHSPKGTPGGAAAGGAELARLRGGADQDLVQVDVLGLGERVDRRPGDVIGL